MKILEQYSKNGYDFKIVHREGNWAIAHGHSRTSNADNWEVFEVQSHNGIMMGQNWVEPCQYVPSNSQWGVKGFTALNEEHAKQILQNKTKN